MSIRILHTSDWHIDVSPKVAPRRADQKQFLDELLEIIDEHKPQVFVHAGDIFDRQLISSTGLKLFTNFLKSLSGTSIQEVFIIAGNHDPSAQLDALVPLLELNTDNSDIRFHLSTSLNKLDGDAFDVASQCHMIDIDGEKLGVALIPFVSSHRLGVHTQSATEQNHLLRSKVSELFKQFADHLEELDATAPLLSVAHLNCWEKQDENVAGEQAPEKIHMGETLSPDTFDARFNYVALGHFHNLRSMDKGRVCYSGTPIPFRRNEIGNKGVMLIDLTKNERKNTFIPIKKPLRASIAIDSSNDTWLGELEQQLLAHPNEVIDNVAIPHYLYLKITDLQETENKCRLKIRQKAQELDRPVKLVSFIGAKKLEATEIDYKAFKGERTFDAFFEQVFNDEYERRNASTRTEKNKDEWLQTRDRNRIAFKKLIDSWREQ